MLNQVGGPLASEAAARFDPSMASLPTPYGSGHTAFMQLVISWREAAWRNAEELVLAPDAAARDRVAARIEAAAAAEAQAIKAATSYVPPLSSSAARDAYCAGQSEQP